ncbi:MAG: DUF819 family protein [Gemmatimonadales bacterium]|nr:DUF819 family protein [Gemmatimonadales bacterium]NIN13408.1 DUF819 family protein [Gemmatimonadales bacterium]NIN51411.1 DUF819 family protein [Gemmatimonadales bacterium]NIP08875.1 DUF819 family protein [Gemmatimonadales bacterium]NIQ99869.1 DUF819 family protein [Gemmatimonadales bacterium]
MPEAASHGLITDPTAVFAFIAVVIAGIFWLSGLPRLKKFFEITPPVIYAYFIPTISTTVGIIPQVSVAYDWMTRYLLPTALFLLMVSVDLKSIMRLGAMALLMVVAGSIGIIVGAPVALVLFGGLLPEEAWKGFAALSGSWIGGTANMVAIAESVGTPDSLMGPIIVIDTVVGYGWMGVLLFFSAWQHKFDARTRARTSAVEETNRRLAEMNAHRHPTELRHAVFMIGMGFGAAALCVFVGDQLPVLGDPTIISHTTWAVLIVVTGGLMLSFTRVSLLEEVGASKIGYTALYLLLGAIGAQADLKAVLDAPAFFGAGVVWIGVHAVVLLLAARLVRAPLFFFATGSMSNIGGAASAPVVASVYHPAMAPVGLLMAVAGYVLGIYGALGCAWILGLIGG